MLNRTFTLIADAQGSISAAPVETKGWWSRHWKKVVGIAAFAIGGPFGGMIGGLLNSGLFERGSEAGYSDSDGNATLSEYEASYLEDWFANVFMPKYEGFIKRGNIIFSTTDVNKQVELINLLNKELAITKEYLKWDNPKLTKLAEETRNSICTELIFEVEKIIFKTIEESTYDFLAENIEVKSTASLLSPIVSFGITFTAIATSYTIKLKENDQDLVANDSVDIDLGLNNQDTPKDVVDQVTQVVDSIPKVKTGLPWWVIALGAWAGYKILK
jgi:hypothetical protein